jgi:hypothetical protein
MCEFGSLSLSSRFSGENIAAFFNARASLPAWMRFVQHRTCILSAVFDFLQINKHRAFLENDVRASSSGFLRAQGGITAIFCRRGSLAGLTEALP